MDEIPTVVTKPLPENLTEVRRRDSSTVPTGQDWGFFGPGFV
jgi:hypothetical protein